MLVHVASSSIHFKVFYYAMACTAPHLRAQKTKTLHT